MEKKNMLQVLLPGAVAACVVLLVGFLVMSSDWNGTTAATKMDKGDPSIAKGTPKPPGGYGTKGEVDSKDFNKDGMSDALPPAEAPEWIKLDGGLKYWDVKEGTGEACPPGAKVVIHYTGWRLDGFVFDSTKDRTVDFALGSLIRGWQLGIPGMKPGTVRRLYIPSELGYGASGGGGGKIPPNSPLIFEIKLLSFSS